MPAVVNITTGDIPADSTQTYQAMIVDNALVPIFPVQLKTLTLTIVDTLTGNVINDCYQQDILNTGRGVLDDSGTGLLTVTLSAQDTDMSGTPGATRIQRSLIFDYVYNLGTAAGRHQVNFFIVQLSGA